MAFDEQLADRVRRYLAQKQGIEIAEKTMFRGLAFLVNEKMCVNVSGDRLMCRFDPLRTDAMSAHSGYEPMIMKGKELAGYCYVERAGYSRAQDFHFWLEACLAFNEKAKASKRKKS